MIAPRWRKAIGDLRARRGRAALAVLAMATGLFEITTLGVSYEQLRPALATMYPRTKPSSATLVVDRADDSLVEAVRRVPGVADAEARPVIAARLRVGPDEWVPARLEVVRDPAHPRLDTFVPEAGAWPGAAGDLLLERTALRVARAAVGGHVVLRTLDGRERTMPVAGTVHAAGLAPAWMEHMVTGFVAWDSPLRTAGSGESAQIRLRATHPLEEGAIREAADSAKSVLERRGVTVSRVILPPPGRHPHAGQMDAFRFLLGAFGLLGFLLGAVVAATTVHSVMAEEVRAIGVMKAIGATRGQVSGLYLAEAGLLAAAAVLAGLPPGLAAGQAYARFSAGILNTDVRNAPFPLGTAIAVILAGLVVPVLLALVPVRRASAVTVREALDEGDGLRIAPGKPGRFARWSAGLPRPLALSLRTTFLRRGSLALTVGMLALGGASFMAALNVASAWRREVDDDFARRRYDLTVLFADPQPVALVDSLLSAVPGVERHECWAGGSPWLVGADGTAGSSVTLAGPAPGSRLLDLPVLAGRWLRADDRDVAVINRAVASANPRLRIGDTLRLRLRGRTSGFAIVGIVKELVPMPVVYAPRAAVLAAGGASGSTTRAALVVTGGHGDAAELAVSGAIERACEARGLEVAGLHRMADGKQGVLDHLVIILGVLVVASLVVVVAGGLGLASAVTLGVVRRTREFGVLGAIGAPPSTIARHVWSESVLVGLLGWVAACALTVPLTAGLEAACGNIFFNAPLAFHLSPLASLAWLGVIVVVSSLASLLPARRASRMPVHAALAHS